MGGIVTSSDARNEHLTIVNNKYPHIKTLLIDCDNDIIKDNYDIIIHWGLLYHLTAIETHLKNVLEKCNILLLETEVYDSSTIEDCITIDEKGYDQSFHNKGTRLSQQKIENILEKNKFQFKIIKDPILNSDFHCYDWDITNSKTFKQGLRRFWICWKLECPITT